MPFPLVEKWGNLFGKRLGIFAANAVYNRIPGVTRVSQLHGWSETANKHAITASRATDVAARAAPHAARLLDPTTMASPSVPGLGVLKTVGGVVGKAASAAGGVVADAAAWAGNKAVQELEKAVMGGMDTDLSGMDFDVDAPSFRPPNPEKMFQKIQEQFKDNPEIARGFREGFKTQFGANFKDTEGKIGPIKTNFEQAFNKFAWGNAEGDNPHLRGSDGEMSPEARAESEAVRQRSQAGNERSKAMMEEVSGRKAERASKYSSSSSSSSSSRPSSPSRSPSPSGDSDTELLLPTARSPSPPDGRPLSGTVPLRASSLSATRGPMNPPGERGARTTNLQSLNPSASPLVTGTSLMPDAHPHSSMPYQQQGATAPVSTGGLMSISSGSIIPSANGAFGSVSRPPSVGGNLIEMETMSSRVPQAEGWTSGMLLATQLPMGASVANDPEARQLIEANTEMIATLSRSSSSGLDEFMSESGPPSRTSSTLPLLPHGGGSSSASYSSSSSSSGSASASSSSSMHSPSVSLQSTYQGVGRNGGRSDGHVGSSTSGSKPGMFARLSSSASSAVSSIFARPGSNHGGYTEIIPAASSPPAPTLFDGEGPAYNARMTTLPSNTPGASAGGVSPIPPNSFTSHNDPRGIGHGSPAANASYLNDKRMPAQPNQGFGQKGFLASTLVGQAVGLIQGALSMVNQNKAQENAAEMQAWQNNENKLMQGRQMAQAGDQERQGFANMMINARQRNRW